MATPRTSTLPSISIITVSYNSEATIEDTILSVLSQNVEKLEYIIIDGGSRDRTLKIVECYRDKIAHVTSEPDAGIYDAMNKGLRIARGEVIGLLNSDDFYASQNTLRKVLEEFKHNKTDIVYGDLCYVSKEDTKHTLRYWKSKPQHKLRFEAGEHPPHPSFFVKKTIYEKYGNFNTELRIASDYEIMLRFLYKHKLSASYIPEVLVKMRTGGKSNRSLKNILKANLECYKAWKMNGLKTSPAIILRKPLAKLRQYARKAPTREEPE